jgi:glucosamine-6-phosphate deaminase
MKLMLSGTKQEMGRRAAAEGAELIRGALRASGHAGIVVATGASQFEMLASLVRENVDWSRVSAFHLDEYIGMSMEHPASFRRYLKERFVDRLPQPIGQFHYIDAEQEPEAECARLNHLIAEATIDVAFVGIGENGHLAFNDPPADFETEDPYLVVQLDEACRRQQLGEGWFGSLEEVPDRAVSMSVRQIMKARAVICTVPDARKAEAVEKAVTGPVTPQVPASILQEHPDCRLFLDSQSASRLPR